MSIYKDIIKPLLGIAMALFALLCLLLGVYDIAINETATEIGLLYLILSIVVISSLDHDEMNEKLDAATP